MIGGGQTGHFPTPWAGSMGSSCNSCIYPWPLSHFRTTQYFASLGDDEPGVNSFTWRVSQFFYVAVLLATSGRHWARERCRRCSPRPHCAPRPPPCLRPPRSARPASHAPRADHTFLTLVAHSCLISVRVCQPLPPRLLGYMFHLLQETYVRKLLPRPPIDHRLLALLCEYFRPYSINLIFGSRPDD